MNSWCFARILKRYSPPGLRRFGFLSLILIPLFLAPPHAAWSKDPGPAPLKIAYCKDTPPFHFTNAAKLPDGILIDYWKLWSKKTNQPVEFIEASWDQTIELVKTGRADIHAGLFSNASREAFMDFGPGMFQADTHVFYHKSLTAPITPRTLKAFRLGVIQGGYTQSWLETHLPGLTLVPFENYAQIMIALKNGGIMVFATDTLTGLNHLRQAGIRSEFTYKPSTPLYSSFFTRP